MQALAASPFLIRLFSALGTPPEEITAAFLLAQLLGLIVTVIGIVGVQFSDIRKILFSQVLINGILAANFLLLPGGRSGAFVCLVGAAQTTCNFIFACQKRETPKWTLWLFLAGYAAAAVYTYTGAISILPFLCSVLFAVAVMQTKPSAYRLFLALNSVIWVVYDWTAGAYTSMLTHGFILISTLVAMATQDRKAAQETPQT